jgi:glycerate kinase
LREAGRARIADRIDVTGLDARLGDAEIVAACDVDSTLLGDEGAARRFGPQKGATREGVEALEKNLARLADIILRDLGRDIRRVRHGGAAGGMAAGIAGILGGRLASGIELVLDWLGFDGVFVAALAGDRAGPPLPSQAGA